VATQARRKLEPEIIKVGRLFRARVTALDDRAASQIVKTYLGSYAKIETRFNRLLAQIAGKEATKGQITRLWQDMNLTAYIVKELARFAGLAGPLVTRTQAVAIALAEDHALKMVNAALPPGIDMKILADAGLAWQAPDPETLASMIGFATDANGAKSPLRALFLEANASGADAARDALTDGIVRGLSPRQVKNALADALGDGLTRSLTIARTETLRAYREGTRAHYEANGDIVKGYKRLAALDSLTCMACIALDGQEYPTDLALPTHPNCRCTTVPITVTNKELGLDVPEAPSSFETGQDWFLRQSETTQLEMMGAGRFAAWQEGKVELDGFVDYSDSQKWGLSEHEATLSGMLAGETGIRDLTASGDK